MGQINLMVISILRCDLDQAQLHGDAALATSIECGAARWVCLCFGNLGHLYFTKGEFDKAIGDFEKVLSLSNTNNENVFLALESIAQVHLAQGLQKRLQFVDVPDESANGVGKYTHRYAQLTKAKILGRSGRWEESDQFVARTLSLAREAHDPVSTTIASMFQAEVLLHRGRKDESWDLITNVLPTLPRCPPDMLARYERILACLLAATDAKSNGCLHRNRAERILVGLQNKSELAELAQVLGAGSKTC